MPHGGYEQAVKVLHGREKKMRSNYRDFRCMSTNSIMALTVPSNSSDINNITNFGAFRHFLWLSAATNAKILKLKNLLKPF